jgi:hypothetical protein
LSKCQEGLVPNSAISAFDGILTPNKSFPFAS